MFPSEFHWAQLYRETGVSLFTMKRAASTCEGAIQSSNIGVVCHCHRSSPTSYYAFVLQSVAPVFYAFMLRNALLTLTLLSV
jgi:hypothetical protein